MFQVTLWPFLLNCGWSQPPLEVIFPVVIPWLDILSSWQSFTLLRGFSSPVVILWLDLLNEALWDSSSLLSSRLVPQFSTRVSSHTSEGNAEICCSVFAVYEFSLASLLSVLLLLLAS